MGRGISFSIGVLAAACATAAAVAGCGASSVSTATATKPATLTVTRGVAAVEPAADPRPLGAADNAFGLDVLRAWCAQHPGQNLVFSPSTLASALGMAYLGSGGATATAMAKVLHLPAANGTTNAAALAAALQARSRALSGLGGPGVTVAASNQVWADPALPTRAGYLNSVATGYDAGLDRAPFSSDPAQAAADINHAISAETHGHINNLVSPDMLGPTGWVLTSALYLNAKWTTAFDANKTQSQTFSPATGPGVSVPFLNGDGYAYASAGGWQAVSLPYQDGKLTMTALLPPAGAAGCALPAPATLASITAALGDGSEADDATIALPKVNLSVNGGDGDMGPVLQRLGMGVAFGPRADFTGLSPQAGSIGFVQQAATLQVGEKGTVGAAAAATGIEAAARPLTDHDVVFNRPYVMVVSAKSTGEPLFLAEVANPSAS